MPTMQRTGSNPTLAPDDKWKKRNDLPALRVEKLQGCGYYAIEYKGGIMNTSTETLTHFSCEKCEKWFTIGDYDGAPVACPRCSADEIGRLQTKVIELADRLDYINEGYRDI